MSDAPFKVGQRVRVKERHRRFYPGFRSLTGVVVDVEFNRFSGGGVWWSVRVRRDGLKTSRWFLADRWELVPVHDLTLDQTAQSLADAVKRGDANAALALADRVFELCGGTPKEP